jgi:hypothetical protein
MMMMMPAKYVDFLVSRIIYGFWQCSRGLSVTIWMTTKNARGTCTLSFPALDAMVVVCA